VRVPRRIRPLFEDQSGDKYWLKGKWYDVVEMDSSWVTFINENGRHDGFPTDGVLKSGKYETESEEEIIDKVLIKYQ
jgi:hypothetical protein